MKPKKNTHIFIVLSLLIVLPKTVQPQDQIANASPTFIIYLENDVFAKTDRNYTHGCGFTWVSRDYNTHSPKPIWYRPFFYLLSILGKPGQYRNYTITLRQNIYTPDDLKETHLIEIDRPYAGVTYLAFGFHEKDTKNISTLDIDVGILGPCSYAASAQKRPHELIGTVDPKGWHHRLKDEVIFNLNFERRWKTLEIGGYRGFGIDIFPHIGGGLGNMKTYAKGGAQFRLGYNIPAKFGSYILQPGCECPIPAREPDQPSTVWGIHFFAALEGQAVLRDIFLDGNTFKDSHSVDKYPMRASFTGGFGLQFHRFQLNYVFTVETCQFKYQKKGHVFGGFTLSISF